MSGEAPASEKRLGALRGFCGAALPGHALVVYEPDTDMVVDVLAAEAALHSEVRSLGHPRAALLAFGTAVVAYNILATLQHAIAVEHRDTTPQLQLSTYHLAVEVRATYQGMMLAVGARVWVAYETRSDRQLARLLRHVARHVPVAAFRKSPRGPKPTERPGYVAFAVPSQHIATARILTGTKTWRRP